MTFSWKLWFLIGGLQTDVMFEADWCIILTRPLISVRHIVGGKERGK